MDAIAERIAAIVARDGPNAIAVYSGTHGLFSSGDRKSTRLNSSH